MKKKILTPLAVGLVALGLTAAQVASAHTGQASITCTSVTFSYASFSDDDDNTVSESVTVDGAGVYADTFAFDDSSGGHTIGIAVPQDGEEHLIEVGASWNTNGHSGSFSDSARLVCGEKPPPPPPEEPPPPPGPPHTCPDGMPPDAGKDGQAGNDDCDHTQPPSETVPPETTPPPVQNFDTTPPPVETTPPAVETKEPPAIVGKPPVSEDTPELKAQKQVKGKVSAAKPDTAPQASPFTL